MSDFSGSDSKLLPSDLKFDIIRCELGDPKKRKLVVLLQLWFVCVLCPFLTVPAVGWSEVFIVAFSWFQENLRFLTFLLLFS